MELRLLGSFTLKIEYTKNEPDTIKITLKNDIEKEDLIYFFNYQDKQLTANDLLWCIKRVMKENALPF